MLEAITCPSGLDLTDSDDEAGAAPVLLDANNNGQEDSKSAQGEADCSGVQDCSSGSEDEESEANVSFFLACGKLVEKKLQII